MDLRRLGLASSPRLHFHHVVLDAAGNGQTSEDAFHSHAVVNGVVQPAEGHTHTVAEEILEQNVAGRLNDAVEMIGLAHPLDLKESSVDTDARVIKNVKLLGGTSVNSGQAAGAAYSSRVYTKEALQNAVPLLEGQRCYANHATDEEMRQRGGNRSYHDFLGSYSNVHFVESAEEIRADLNVVAGDAGDKLLDTADRFPHALGLSVDAQGHGYVDDSGDAAVLVVESLTSAFSVDVVDRPGSTLNLFESAGRSLREHYAHGRLTPTETPAMTGKKTTTPTQGGDPNVTRLEQELREERTKREEAEAKVTELTEADSTRAKQAETRAVVARVLESKSNLPERLATRIREHFKDSTADEAAVTAHVEAEVEHYTETLREAGADPADLGLAPVETKESAGDKPDAGDVLALSESAFGGMCGVDMNADSKPKD